MNFAHPAFTPYRELIRALGLERGMPSLDALNALARDLGAHQSAHKPLRFVAPSGKIAAREYETRIFETGEVPTRAETWHDILNALVWLRFPRFKAAVNAAHGNAIALETQSLRGRRRDALTVIDESGVWFASREPALPTLLAERHWIELFWKRRDALGDSATFVVVGHALLEKALDPYPAMTGKCLTLAADALDADAVEALAIAALGAVDTPRALPPLPVQGIPGWDPANAHADYYADETVFRPAPAAPA